MEVARFVCECGNIVYADVRRLSDGNYYTDNYCLPCHEVNPLNVIVVQKVRKVPKECGK